MAVAEKELAAHVRKVAAQRQALPPGAVIADHRFVELVDGETHELGLVDLFDGYDELIVYHLDRAMS